MRGEDERLDGGDSAGEEPCRIGGPRNLCTTHPVCGGMRDLVGDLRVRADSLDNPPAGARQARLFVIRQLGRQLYWACSPTHGSGWVEARPRQSFSPSELTGELRRLIDQGWFTDLEILELHTRS